MFARQRSKSDTGLAPHIAKPTMKPMMSEDDFAADFVDFKVCPVLSCHAMSYLLILCHMPCRVASCHANDMSVNLSSRVMPINC